MKKTLMLTLTVLCVLIANASSSITLRSGNLIKDVEAMVQEVPENMYRVTAQKVNVRSAASTKSTIVGSLLRDEQVEVKEIKGGWATIVYKGSTRFVSANYLEKIEPQVVEEVVEEEIEEEVIGEKAVVEEVASATPTKQGKEKILKAFNAFKSKKDKKAKEKAAKKTIEKEKKSKARADKKDNDGDSRFPSFKPEPKYMGEWHIGYATTSHIDGYRLYNAHVQTGFLQGVTINEYLECGIGVDALMNTHYHHGGDFDDISWFIATYVHARGFFPLKPKFKPFITLDMGPSWCVKPSSSKPSFYLEFGPGFRWKQFDLFFGLQKTGKGKGTNHFVSKVGWYF